MKSKQKIILGLLVVVMSISSYAYVNYNYAQLELANTVIEEIEIEEPDDFKQDADIRAGMAKFALYKVVDLVRQIL